MSKGQNEENKQIVFLVACFVLLCGLSYRILFLEQINGTEFVALIIAAMFICLVGYFLKEIQEFSVGGNLIKLKEAKNDVIEAIDQLKQFRVETFRLFLTKSLELSGGWGTIGLMDERVLKFIDLYSQIEVADCVADLKDDISKVVIILIESHLTIMLNMNEHLKNKFKVEGLLVRPSPHQILLAISDEMLNGYKEYTKRSEEEVKAELDEAIRAYTTLLIIEKKCA